VIVVMLFKESALIGIQAEHQISVPALITISVLQCRCGQGKSQIRSLHMNRREQWEI